MDPTLIRMNLPRLRPNHEPTELLLGQYVGGRMLARHIDEWASLRNGQHSSVDEEMLEQQHKYAIVAFRMHVPGGEEIFTS